MNRQGAKTPRFRRLESVARPLRIPAFPGALASWRLRATLGIAASLRSSQ